MRSRPAYVVAFLLVVGGLLRAVYLVTPIMDSDQAVFGLQGRHVLLGEFPVFSWGYAYIGTLQSFLDALAFALFGASRLVLNVVPLVLSLGFVLATYALGRELGGEAVGLLGATLVAVAPPYLAIHGAWARHGYMDTLLLGTVVLVLALRLGRRPLEDARAVRLYAVLGVTGGLAWWTNFLSLFYLVPAVLFLLLRDWRCLGRRGPWVALAFFLVGSAPFWVWNLLHAFGSFRLFRGGDVPDAALRLLGLATEGLPAILGARSSLERTNLVPGLSEALMALYAIAFLWLAGRQLARAARRESLEPGPALLLLFFATSAVVLALSRYGAAVLAGETKRYLLPLYPALPLLGALLLDRVRVVSGVAFGALAALVLGLHLYGTVLSYPVVKGEGPALRQARASDAELFRFLRARGLTRVFVTDYWLAPRLTFDAGEEIVFAQPFGDRYPAYTRLVEATPRSAYVFAAGGAGHFEALLRAIGATFERTVLSAYEVFYDFRPPAGAEALASLPATGWRATARPPGDEPRRAFDRDVDTSWYSREPQRPGFVFEVDLGRPWRIAKVVLLPPRPSIGFPRGYRVEVSGDGRAWQETAGVGAGPWSLDWVDGQPRIGVRSRAVSVFEPRQVRYIRIHQTGSDPKWWWAVGELFVFAPAPGGRDRPEAGVRAYLERGARLEAAGELAEALRAYWEAARLEPDAEPPHARLAALYERGGIPVEGAVPPGARAEAFEAVGLFVKAAPEYAKEVRRLLPHQRSDLWRRLARAARAAGEDAEARAAEERLAREFAAPVAASARFEDEVRFLGYGLEALGDRAFRLTYYWEALRRPSADYTFFVHFVRGDRIVFQHDHAPLGGVYPARLWPAGERVRETFELTAPARLEAGAYDIVVGVWDPKTGRRLRVTETTVAHRGDRVVVGRLTLGSRS